VLQFFEAQSIKLLTLHISTQFENVIRKNLESDSDEKSAHKRERKYSEVVPLLGHFIEAFTNDCIS